MTAVDNFMTRYHLQLNDQQKAAVMRIEGATLLLAVPGSGKTTVIISRIAYMIRAFGIPPEKILTLTFSRAGAADLEERYRKRFGDEEVGRLRFSTIHSFSLSVIRNWERLYKREAFAILDQPGVVIREIYIELFKNWPSENDMADILSAMTYCKNMMLSEQEIESMKVGDIPFSKLYRVYEKYKCKKRLMDFDDMLKYAWILLKNNPELLEMFKKQYRYINVDEAQDTSKIQFEILKLLVDQNIFMVGDEDQSIYGFRGAYPEGLLNFKKDYPDGEILVMETNYRSTQKIVAAADRFIRLNQNRYLKQMRTDNAVGVPAVHQYVKTVEDQYRLIMESVKNEKKDIAVLYRNNESVIPFVDLFEREGIAYRLKEHNALFFTHFIVQDIRDFFKLAEDPSDFEIFEKIYYKMNCSISRKNMQAVKRTQMPGQSVFDALQSLPGMPEWLIEKVSAIQVSFKRLRKMAPLEGIDYIEGHMGYSEHLVYRISCGFREETLMQKLAILKTLAAREKTQADFWNHLNILKKTLESPESKGKAAVTFSTIHSSKGLEFEKVFIVDAVDGEFPSKAALEKTEEGKRLLEEEIRLFYVGVTRAKRELELISVGKKGSRSSRYPVSRFIRYFMGEKQPKDTQSECRTIGGGSKTRSSSFKEKTAGALRLGKTAPKGQVSVDCSAYQIGTRVIHKGFGAGVISAREDQMAVVSFEKVGDKKLNLEICVSKGLLKRGGGS